MTSQSTGNPNKQNQNQKSNPQSQTQPGQKDEYSNQSAQDKRYVDSATATSDQAKDKKKSDGTSDV